MDLRRCTGRRMQRSSGWFWHFMDLNVVGFFSVFSSVLLSLLRIIRRDCFWDSYWEVFAFSISDRSCRRCVSPLFSSVCSPLCSLRSCIFLLRRRRSYGIFRLFSVGGMHRTGASLLRSSMCVSLAFFFFLGSEDGSGLCVVNGGRSGS